MTLNFCFWDRERIKEQERKNEKMEEREIEREEKRNLPECIWGERRKKSIIVKYIASNKLTINDVSDQLKPSIYFEEIEKRLEFDTIL